MRLVNLKPEGKIVFVGDIHGDLFAVKKVINLYLKPGYKIVFLGDYMDRGEYSQECVDLLLKMKKENPNQIILLQGNHEAYCILKLYPADFWEALNPEECKFYGKTLTKLPLAVSVDGVLALHGGLPNIENLEDIEKIKDKDKNWKAILWADFLESGGDDFINEQDSRPMLSKQYFLSVMKQLGKNVLIRAHQPDSPLVSFNKKCLTIFTSKHYKSRRVAILDFDKHETIKSTADLEIVNLDKI